MPLWVPIEASNVPFESLYTHVQTHAMLESIMVTFYFFHEPYYGKLNIVGENPFVLGRCHKCTYCISQRLDVAYIIKQEITKKIGEEICCIEEDVPLSLRLTTCGHGKRGHGLFANGKMTPSWCRLKINCVSFLVRFPIKKFTKIVQMHITFN